MTMGLRVKQVWMVNRYSFNLVPAEFPLALRGGGGRRERGPGEVALGSTAGRVVSTYPDFVGYQKLLSKNDP